MTSADRDTEAATHESDAHTPRASGWREPRAFAPLVLQAPLEPRDDGRYRIEELLALHDRAFVESAYAAALGREPTTDELSATLADLRALRREKLEIVEDLIASDEGRRAGARITGIAPGWKRRARRLPVVGYLWQLIVSVVRLPVALRHARESDAYLLAQQQVIADYVNATSEESRRLIDDAIAAVSVLSDALAALADRQSGFERRLDDQHKSLEAQHEFLAREQQAVVEAQKAALVEIEARLRDALASHADALSKLSAPAAHDPERGHDPRALVEEARAQEGDAGAA